MPVAIPPPLRTADRLAARYAEISATAAEVAGDVLVPAIVGGEPTGVIDAADEVGAELRRQHSDEWIAEQAKPAAEAAERRHSRLFFAAAAVALRVRLVGLDDRGRPLQGSPGRTGAPPYRVQVSASPALFMSQFVDQNVSLISTVRDGIPDAIGDLALRDAVFGGDVSGAPLTRFEREDAANRLLKVWREQGVPTKIPIRRLRKDGSPVMLNARKHARLIARDQISKLNGQLNRARQMAAGIRFFQWRTQRDPRVRDGHRALHGKIFSWDEGAPGVGIPGQPVQCRCYGGAVVGKDRVAILARGDWIPVDAAEQSIRFVPGSPRARGRGPGAEIPSSGRVTFDPDT